MAWTTAWRILGDAADAEDAVQDAFLDAVRLVRQGAVGDWGALLRRLATCRALDLLRGISLYEGRTLAGSKG